METKEGAGFCSDVKKCGVKAPCTDGEAQRQKDKGRNGGGGTRALPEIGTREAKSLRDREFFIFFL